MNKLITIFTPTYNRAHLLPRLYESLCGQNSQNFIWLVIDDGSSDSTQALMEGYVAQGKITIQFLSIENGGKHRAINRAVAEASTELFFIVDSDDYLTADAVASIERKWSEYSGNEPLAGLCFRRATLDGALIGRSFIQDEGILASMLQITYLHKINTDRAEVFSTEVLRKFQFDEIAGEKFLPEALVWNRISRKAPNKLWCTNQVIYLCDYQDGGLSHQFKKLLKTNPIGLMRYYGELLCTPFVWRYPKTMIKAMIRWCQTLFYRISR